MDWMVTPGKDGALSEVLPSVLAALGTAGFTDSLGIPRCRAAAVLLVDGLGWELLREHAADAPFLASLAVREPIKAGFPTTTATSITSLGTGL
ncbi:MAG: alkaline phosphatase family protein, partial [Saccharopolyspora sp.]